MELTKETIKQARLAINLTTDQAARLVYVSRRAWEGWEAGVTPLNKTAAELFLRKVSGSYWKDPEPDYGGVVIVLADDGITPLDAVSGSNFLGLYEKAAGTFVIKSLSTDRFGRTKEHSRDFNVEVNQHVVRACEQWERQRREAV